MAGAESNVPAADGASCGKPAESGGRITNRRNYQQEPDRRSGNRRNYQQELDSFIETLKAEGRRPKLLLHACCAPCSSYCIEYLAPYFDITVFFYNPNIDNPLEYRRRVAEEQRFISEFPAASHVDFLEGTYEPDVYHEAVRGHEKDPERGERCTICFRQRLQKTAETAKAGGFDFFTTTLSISPQKDPALLNAIGGELSEEYGVSYLFSEFRKKGGYLRSTQLSKEYGLYRQDYCGCSYSFAERERQKESQNEVMAAAAVASRLN